MRTAYNYFKNESSVDRCFGLKHTELCFSSPWTLIPATGSWLKHDMSSSDIL